MLIQCVSPCASVIGASATYSHTIFQVDEADTRRAQSNHGAQIIIIVYTFQQSSTHQCVQGPNAQIPMQVLVNII